MTVTPWWSIATSQARRTCATLVAMTRMVAPRAPLSDMEQRRKVRAYRVEVQGLPYCRTCGGATGEPDDVTLRCDCEDRARELVGRIHQILDEHGDHDDRRSLALVVAP